MQDEEKCESTSLFCGKPAENLDSNSIYDCKNEIAYFSLMRYTFLKGMNVYT